nr:TPA_asm: ND1 [Gammarus pulex]
MTWGSYFFLLIMVLVGVAFITLIEQKILGSMQIRVGPNYVGYWGVFQPFSDAVKLLSKESFNSRVATSLVYYTSPVAGLTLSLFLWAIYPFSDGGLSLSYSILFFMGISGMGIYAILGAGWVSNCKYSMLGSLRAVAQMISYEASLGTVFLSLVWLSNSFKFSYLIDSQYMVYNIFLLMPLGYIWLVSSLAETNRSPYDFAEGESELVSGFNTEYGSAGFVLIFMAEYASILLMSLLFSILFLSSSFSTMVAVKTISVGFVFVWVRASLPRYRYDKLMGLAWKSFLPISLLLFFYYLSVGLSCSLF